MCYQNKKGTLNYFLSRLLLNEIYFQEATRVSL